MRYICRPSAHTGRAHRRDRVMNAEIEPLDELNDEALQPIFNTSSRGLGGVKFGILITENSNNPFVPIFHIENKTLLAFE